MASLHTGSDVLLSVRTDLLELTVKGPASHPSFPGVTIPGKGSALRISCRDQGGFRTEISGDHETAALTRTPFGSTGEYRVTPLFFEQRNYEIIIEPLEPGHSISFWHENYHIRKNITPAGRSGMLTGVINFRNEIGMSDLVIGADGDERYLVLSIEVFPSKISYKDDYKAIVTDVTAEVYSLVFDFLKRTYESFDVTASGQSSDVEFFAIIRKICGDFLSAADVILRSPHHELRKEHEVLPFFKARHFDSRTLRWAENHPQYLVRDGKRLQAEKMLAVRQFITFDTRENRLTKFMLEQTAARLIRFKARLAPDRNDPPAAYAEIIRTIDGMVNGIRRRCESGFMREVHSSAENTGMSLVFGMAPGYRELYRCYLLLQHGLSLTGDVFNVSLKDLAVLYEYWCFIKLNRLLKDKYELISQDIIRVSGAGLFVTLVKGAGSRVKYRDPKTGETFTLSYNPKETGLPTGTQRPDNVLRLEKKDADTAYEYVFDAKYRVNPALPGTDYYNTICTLPGPETDDINTMHRYRDAIVYQSGVSPFERTMFGAYVLFPYHNEEEYHGHRFYKSIEEVNIGGLPFLPSATGLVTRMLDELISDSPDSAFERATLPAGIEKRLAKVDWSRRDVLIGTLRSREQLDVCREGHFYYVPAGLVEKHLPVRYIAIYQTISLFGEEGAGIFSYGEVGNYRIVRRKEITEIPRDSDEFYYRFEIPEWKKLAVPVKPKETGGVVLFTNLFLLRHSAYVSDLLVKSEEEYRLLTELRRRSDASVINSGDLKNGFTFGESTIIVDGAEILTYTGGRLTARCSVRDFMTRPNASLRQILKSVQ